ncbi:hypothetical protein PB01_19605 [Psychrobacillus glaciei]|uniref:Uncharacterized protein n=1 Tax=Psychrobacillus glaciei TaxID=2283160 RepID=A0A5J6SUT8_9BACI|nr:hypothetical protein [Psychrobacillus glaciei]QFG00825.1 hypothetical protein PB01_19605 [Psychrobacillus glaciei]
MLVTKALPHDVALLAFVPHRSPRGTLPPETEIRGIFYSLKYYEHWFRWLLIHILSYLSRKAQAPMSARTGKMGLV